MQLLQTLELCHYLLADIQLKLQMDVFRNSKPKTIQVYPCTPQSYQ